MVLRLEFHNFFYEVSSDPYGLNPFTAKIHVNQAHGSIHKHKEQHQRLWKAGRFICFTGGGNTHKHKDFSWQLCCSTFLNEIGILWLGPYQE